MLIKALLMIAIGGIALLLLRGNRGGRHQAIRRLLLLSFVAFAGFSLLFPLAWTRVAQLLGVGRGTDLLLYALIVAFLGGVATTYSRFVQQQRMITALSRRLALLEAPEHRDAAARLTPEYVAEIDAQIDAELDAALDAVADDVRDAAPEAPAALPRQPRA
jgi:hypothetical protein